MNEKFEQIYNISKGIKEIYEEIIMAIQKGEEVNVKFDQLQTSLNLEKSLYDKLNITELFALYTRIPSSNNLLEDISNFNDSNFIEYRILEKVRNIIYQILNKTNQKTTMFYLNDHAITVEKANLINSIKSDINILLDYLLSVETNSKDDLIWARLFLAYTDSSLEQSFIKELGQVNSISLNFPFLVSFYKLDNKVYEKLREVVVLEILTSTIHTLYKVLKRNIDKKEAIILVNQKIIEAGLYLLNDEASLDLNQQVHDEIDKGEDSCEEVIQCFRKMKYNKRHIPNVNVRFINQ